VSFARPTRWNADFGWLYFELPIDIGYGVNFKIIDIALAENTASGIGVDAGLRVSTGLDDLFADERYGRLSFGLGIFDLTDTGITWDTDSKHKDIIERRWRYGFAYTQPLYFLTGEMTFIYDIDTRYEGSAHLGLEYVYGSMLALRLGSNDGKFTAGAGIHYWKFNLDYAFQSHDLGNMHRVGIEFSL
jgi:hypothetical protein